MTKDEILIKLDDLGIIKIISGVYFITEKYKDVSATIVKAPAPVREAQNILDVDTLMNTDSTEESWSVDILHTSGRTRSEHFMNACEIPEIGGTPSKSYRLRGLPKECLVLIDNIIKSPDISPKSMIEAVKVYYKYTEYPKSFKNLLLEGEVFNLYNEYIKGTLVKSMKPKDNSSDIWN